MQPPNDTHELFEQDDEMLFTELPDGSAIVDLPEEDEAAPAGFYDNLAESIDRFTLNTASSDLIELLEKDKEARKKRDEQYEEGLRRTGLGDDAPGGATFDGASTVVHPLLAEGCVDFAAKTIKELFPAAGPVKIKIEGEAIGSRIEQAKRKRDFLNWYLTNKVEEYRAEKEVMLTQLPLGGSQYEKYWFDPITKRVRMSFVPVDKVLLPYSAASFYTSPRVTEVQDITRAEFEARVKSGFYTRIDLATEAAPEETNAERANDKIEGLTESCYNEDGLRRIFEVACWRDDFGDESAPYVVHIDEATKTVIAVYRNWKEEDEAKIKLDWWVEDKFIPWRGAYGIGFPHLIGGLSGTLTGALRALLDSAHINNSPGAVKLKGGRMSGANTQVAQTQIQELDAPTGVDDIRKVMMPLPFNPPSPVLFQLLDWLTAQAKGVVATAEERIADVGSNMPVGTALALIEQGSQVFSSIHTRLHFAQARGLKIICRLIHDHPEEHMEDLQRFGLTVEDFDDDTGIEPVSDPNIFSESQRYAQFQAGMQLAQTAAQAGVQVNMPVLIRRGYELLRFPGVDEFLPKPPEPVTADPATENVAAMSGKSLKAQLPQDHLAHIMTHLGFIISPTHQMVPMPMPQLGGLMAHIVEHTSLFYETLVQAQMVLVNAQGMELSPDQAAAQAAQTAQQMMVQSLQQLAPMFEQAGKAVAAKTPPPPMDPAVKATFDVGMAEVERKKAVDAETLKLKQGELTMGAKLDQMQAVLDIQIATMREENAKQLAGINNQVELMKNDADNRQKQMTELMKNHEDNQTAYLVAQMKEQIAAETANTAEVLRALLAPQPAKPAEE